MPLLGSIISLARLAGSGLWVLVVGTAASALSLYLAVFFIERAEGKPALQALAATIMVACTAVACAIFECSYLCSLLALVPLGLAGK